MPKISALPVATILPLQPTDLIVCVQGGVTSQATVADLAGATGGPHWDTPTGGQLQWNAVGSTFPGCIRLDDTGFTFQVYYAGSAVHWTDAAGTDSVIESHGGGAFSILINNNWAWNVTIVAGGQINLASATNVLTVAGFATCTYQFTNQTGAYW